MINLRNTYVRVNTREECEKFFEIARKQGYKWVTGGELRVFEGQKFPDVLRFRSDGTVATGYHHNLYIASEIIDENRSEEKEMTAREFIEGMIKCVAGCINKNCSSCVLSTTNVHCSGNLCKAYEWKGNEEKLLEIVRKKLNEMTDEKAVALLQSYLDDNVCKTPEEQEAIKLAIRKLRGE